MTEKLIRDTLMLFTTIDPIGTLVLFSAITAHLSASERARTALKATLYASAILVGAVIVGQLLLVGLGVRLVSLQIAGGLILFLFGLQMIFGHATSGTDQTDQWHALAIFPLAVPSIASPGAIMAVIILTDNDLYSIPVQIMTTGILLGILALTYALMLLANPILRVIGTPGAELLIRVSGMILAALAVELTVDGIVYLLQGPALAKLYPGLSGS